MAEYMILIYGTEAERTAEQYDQLMEAHNRFPAQVEALGGKLVDGKGLQTSATATSIRADVVTDGPFVETKEVFGGFYLIEADDLDQALKIAKVCPAPFGGVEVRPVMIFD